jgi:hypothetical protein
MAPNLGKSRLMFVWSPLSHANLQHSVNPKPPMVGIPEEPPCHIPYGVQCYDIYNECIVI